MNQITKLLTLSSDNPLAADCLDQSVRGDELRYRDDCLIPLAQALDIYSVRARINVRRSGKVEGFSNLLPSLEAASVSSVRIHSLEFLSNWFIAFTDESSSFLFGILKLPKEKAAWNDYSKGFVE